MSDADRIAQLEGRVKELENDRKSFFKTGIITLGGLVVVLLGYIWRTHGG